MSRFAMSAMLCLQLLPAPAEAACAALRVQLRSPSGSCHGKLELRRGKIAEVTSVSRVSHKRRASCARQGMEGVRWLDSLVAGAQEELRVPPRNLATRKLRRTQSRTTWLRIFWSAIETPSWMVWPMDNVARKHVPQKRSAALTMQRICLKAPSTSVAGCQGLAKAEEK